jgi:hypothetical protein
MSHLVVFPLSLVPRFTIFQASLWVMNKIILPLKASREDLPNLFQAWTDF